jgi:DNA-binding HxlR family transcriptional regulator
MPEKKNLHEIAGKSRAGTPVSAMVESIVGCKWSLAVLACIRRGVNRPGAIERANAGLSTKVLSERLDKMVRFGILDRKAFAEVPPRVEYEFTPFGLRFLAILQAVEELELDLARTEQGGGSGPRR